METKLYGLEFEVVASAEIGWGDGSTTIGKLKNGKLFIFEICYPYDDMESFTFLNLKIEEFIKGIEEYKKFDKGEYYSEEIHTTLNIDYVNNGFKYQLFDKKHNEISQENFIKSIEETSFTVEEFILEFLKQKQEGKIWSSF